MIFDYQVHGEQEAYRMEKRNGAEPTIGILTGGGDVPGLNPCIKTLVYRAVSEGVIPSDRYYCLDPQKSQVFQHPRGEVLLFFSPLELSLQEIREVFLSGRARIGAGGVEVSST